MNLINCENCGVVLNKKAVHFAHDIWNENGELDEDFGTYSFKEEMMVAYVRCPVCNEKVLDE
jgi:hypothetical protein